LSETAPYSSDSAKANTHGRSLRLSIERSPRFGVRVLHHRVRPGYGGLGPVDHDADCDVESSSGGTVQRLVEKSDLDLGVE
jgi:hypothetical protein